MRRSTRSAADDTILTSTPTWTLEDRRTGMPGARLSWPGRRSSGTAGSTRSFRTSRRSPPITPTTTRRWSPGRCAGTARRCACSRAWCSLRRPAPHVPRPRSPAAPPVVVHQGITASAFPLRPSACRHATPRTTMGRGIDDKHERPRDLPVLADGVSTHAWVPRPRGVRRQLAIALPRCCLPPSQRRQHPETMDFAAQ